jgi:ABC-type sugar transport system ATPase subunit
MRKKAEEIFAAMRVDIPVDVPLEFLSQDKQQMVELAKVLSLDPEIIIFDENFKQAHARRDGIRL